MDALGHRGYSAATNGTRECDNRFATSGSPTAAKRSRPPPGAPGGADSADTSAQREYREEPGTAAPISLDSWIACVLVPPHLRGLLRRHGCLTLGDILSADGAKLEALPGIDPVTRADLVACREVGARYAGLLREAKGVPEALVSTAPEAGRRSAQRENSEHRCASPSDEDEQGDAMARPESVRAAEQEQAVCTGGEGAGRTTVPAKSEVLTTSIVETPMPTRLRNRLVAYGARSLGDVLDVDEERFARLPGVGQKTLDDLSALQAAIRRGDMTLAADGISAAPGPASGAAPCASDQPISLETPVDRLALSTRLRNRLGHNGLVTIDDVLRIDMAEFAELRGVGRITVAELYDLRAWIREHVPGAADAPNDDQNPAQAELGAEAKRTLRSVVQARDLEVSSDDLAAVMEIAAAEGPVASLSMLLCEVVDRTNICRSVEDPDRDSTIWLEYHGVLTGKARTLEVLARRNRLSRERVRQIIATVSSWAGALLRMDKRYAPQLEALRDALASCLGVARLQEFVPLIQRAAGWAEPPTRECLVALAALLEGTPDAFAIDNGSGIVRHYRACDDLWAALHTVVHEAVNGAGEGQHVLDFAYSLAHHVRKCARSERNDADLPLACCGARDGRARLPEAYVRALLSTLDPCPLFRDTVLSADWAYLRLGRVKKEVVRAALRVIGKPVHYSELAQFIRAHNRRWQRADDRSIHSCLTTHEEFVVTGELGVYGLREWDVQPYLTAADHVEAYLRQRGRPAPMWQIVQALEAKGVPENRVRAGFDQQRFTQHSDGTIGLSEWAGGGYDDQPAECSVGSLFADDSEDSFIMG